MGDSIDCIQAIVYLDRISKRIARIRAITSLNHMNLGNVDLELSLILREIEEVKDYVRSMGLG